MKKILLILCLLMIVKISFSQTIGQEILNYNNGCGNPTTDSGGVVIRTKYPFIATGYMPTMIIEGYNYGLNQSVGLIINWYVYNNGSIPYFYHKSISSYGAYAPEAYIYNDAGFVSIFLKRGVSQYCLSFKVRSWLRDINESSSNNSWYLGWTANTINTPPTGVNNYQNLRYENTIGDATVLGSRPIRLNSGAGSIKIKGDTGGWAMDHGFLGSGGADLGGFWGYGAANAIDQWSIGKAYTDNFFVVKSSGNVGIGTNTPSAKLEVVGNANISGIFKTANIEVGNLSGDNNIQIGSGGGTIGNRWAYLDLVGDDKYNDYGLRLIRQNTGENAASQIIHRGTGDLQIYTNDFAPISFITGATEKMRVAANGNVGIGTIAPSEKFTVYGVNNSAPAILSLESSREDIANADVAMIKFKNSGNEIARIGTIRPAGSYTGLINFWVKKTNETPLFEAMRISESGNVGIGTTNPISALHINQSSTNYTSPAISITGKSLSNNGDGNGYGIYLAYNLGNNRQLALADNETKNGVRFIGTFIDGYNTATGTRQDLTLGTETNGVHVGQGSTNLQFSVSNFGGNANKVVSSIYGALGQVGDYFQVNSATSTATSTNGDIFLIKSNGNVGIGSTNPTNKLEIKADLNASGLTFTGLANTSATAARPLAVDNTGKVILGTGGGSDINWTKTGNDISSTNSGSIGIGTTTPTPIYGKTLEINNTFGGSLHLKSPNVQSYYAASDGLNGGIIGTGSSHDFSIITSGQNRIIVKSNGNVTIGTTSTPLDYKLAVGGNVIAERVVVKLQNTWPDYVFNTNYGLRPLEQVEQFINQNSHLPEVPSAQEISDKGIDVGAMNAKLLQKVEELTLYLIEQNKENKVQNNEIAILKQQLENVKNKK